MREPAGHLRSQRHGEALVTGRSDCLTQMGLRSGHTFCDYWKQLMHIAHHAGYLHVGARVSSGGSKENVK